jgi:hypothetical protein
MNPPSDELNRIWHCEPEGELCPNAPALWPNAQQAETLEFWLGDTDSGQGTAGGMAMAAWTGGLTSALRAGQRVVLHDPPQLLVHNLYRVGCYPHPLLMVHNPREEEPYG